MTAARKSWSAGKAQHPPFSRDPGKENHHLFELGRISRQRMSALFEPYIRRAFDGLDLRDLTLPLYININQFPLAWAFFFTIYMGSLTNGSGC